MPNASIADAKARIVANGRGIPDCSIVLLQSSRTVAVSLARPVEGIQDEGVDCPEFTV